MFQKFKEAGLLVIPENNGVPLKGVQWSTYNLDTVPDFSKKKCDGYGLVCGEVSNVIGIDIDDDESVKVIESFLGNPTVKKRGGKGYTAFFKYNGEKSQVWKKEGEIIAELLSNGRKTTIPPSKYKQTKENYEYLSGDLLTTELTELPDNFIQVMDALYPKPQKTWVAPRLELHDDVEFGDAESMLSHINPDLPYDEWIAIGMSLKSEFGDSAFQLWDNWSSRGGKYKPKNMYNHWRSFDNGGITIGTLCHYAKEAGYIKPLKEVSLDDYEIDLSYLEVIEKKEITAHGLVGEIAAWITETAYRPQPMLALGAALTFVGTIKGHIYSTNSDLRSNFLAMNIAPTASGKEHPLNCIYKLIKECGIDKHLMSEPQSGTALLRGILSADRVGLLTIDEVGRYFGNIALKNSGGFQKEILDYIIKSFSKANSLLVGKQYANEKMNPTIKIYDPHLCVLGASVKEKIVESCTSSDAIDGFLNRWILFESEERPKRKRGFEAKKEIPESIVQKIKNILENKALVMEDEQPATRIVKFSPQAYQIFEEYSDRIETLIETSNHPLDALYGRSCEHVAKIALILCDNINIRERDVETAIEIVTESNKLIASLTGLIADNEQERMAIRVLGIVKKRKSISHSDLIRSTKFLNAKTRKEILQDLVESGEIKAEKVGKSYKYSS